MNALEKISDALCESISEDYISQVRAFGALGYSPQRIASMLGLTGSKRLALIYRITKEGDTYANAYRNGNAIGEYNIDAELAKQAEKGDVESIRTLEQRKNDRAELDVRRELFGV